MAVSTGRVLAYTTNYDNTAMILFIYLLTLSDRNLFCSLLQSKDFLSFSIKIN